MIKYQVDKEQMDDYIKSFDKRRTTVFVIVTVAILSVQSFIAYNLDNDFPFWLIVVVTVAISLAFYIGLRLANDRFKQLSNGQFFIDNSSLRFEGVDSLTRNFKLDEIAVIHTKYSGTMILKGNGWTKFNYIRPKRAAYQPGDQDVIFIPTITSNYNELVNAIKQATKNAMKL